MEKIVNFDWASVQMEALLVVFAALTLVFAACSGRKFGKAVSAFAFVGMYAALVVNFVFPQASCALLSQNNAFGALIVICSIFTAQMSFGFFAKTDSSLRNEFIAVLMICAASLSLFVRSNNLMLTFVALESATICLYVMTAFGRNVLCSVEAGIKYVIVGGLSGAVLLMGIALAYGAGRTSGVDFLWFENFSTGLMNKMFFAAAALILAGVFFKIAAFPFQFWAPDVYQGAPTPVSAFLAVASKAAGIVFLAKFCAAIKFDSPELLVLREHLITAVSAVAILTMLIGNLGGITQVRVKRLMAFSGISNAGYLLVLVVAMLKEPSVIDTFAPVLYFYLGAYMLANYAIFFTVNGFEGADDSMQSLSDYRGMMRKSPATAMSMITSLASLAGIPPTAGFFGKLLVLLLAWNAQLYWLIGVLILGSAISIYYYFGWIRAMLEKSEKRESVFAPTPSTKATVVVLAVAVVAVSTIVFSFAGA